MKGFLLRMDPGLHKKLKVIAATKGTSVTDIILKAVEKEIVKEKN